ncbi:MAG: cation:dicarboxylase symporter family transporter, partial [Phycisphaerales bacterium]|nr:cation:dicarboxylase symporter family transporter [Phycisphaerales bacterium]
MRKDTLITVLILVGLVAGAIVGQLLHMGLTEGESLNGIWMELGNIIIIRPLKLLIMPIVFLSVIVGVTSIGDPSKLGVIGGSTVLYYLVTMLLAVVLGTALVTTIQPGAGIDPEVRMSLIDQGETDYQEGKLDTPADVAKEDGLGGAWMKILKQLIPTNVFEELVQGNPLGVIVFALLLGLALAATGPPA